MWSSASQNSCCMNHFFRAPFMARFTKYLAVTCRLDSPVPLSFEVYKPQQRAEVTRCMSSP
jgi:hypothetical protein